MSTAIAPTAPAVESISLSIATLRDQRVILDVDLAAIYGVQTKRLNEQIKRNAARFPADFMFQLTGEESAALRSQFATLKTDDKLDDKLGDKAGRGQHRKYQPYVFTEHGAIMAAMVLGSPHAVEVSVFVVRAFVRLRQAATLHADLAKRLAELEMKTDSLDVRHDTFSRNTRNQLRQVFEALRELADKVTPTEPPAPPKRPIGFVHPEDKPAPKTSKAIKVLKAIKGKKTP